MTSDVRKGCGSIRIGLDIWDCNPDLLTDPNSLEKILIVLIKEEGLGHRKTFVDRYEGHGVGYEMLLTLEDSYILVETWPAEGGKCPLPYAKVVIELCHYSRERANSAYIIADGIENAFRVAGTTLRVERLVTRHGP